MTELTPRFQDSLQPPRKPIRQKVVIILVFLALAFIVGTVGKRLATGDLFPRLPINTATTTNQNSATTTSTSTESWQTYRNEEYGFEFRYPASSNSIRDIEEAVKIVDCEPNNFPEQCPLYDLHPLTEENSVNIQSLNDTPYCVENFTEGAAGSQYSTRVYSFPKGNSCFTLTLTWLSGSCSPYIDSPGPGDTTLYKECLNRVREREEEIDAIEKTFKLF